MESYSPIIVLIVNVLRTLLVKKAMDIFLSLDDVEKKSLKIGLGVYCMLTTIVYSMFQVSVVYEICNCLGMITLTCFYQEIWKKRLWVSLVLFSLDMACSLIVLFIFGACGISATGNSSIADFDMCHGDKSYFLS